MICGGHPRPRCFALLPVLALLCVFASSTLVAEKTQLRVEITAEDSAAVAQRLIDAGFDVPEGSIAEGSLEVVVSDAELKRLREMGFEANVIARGRPFAEVQEERASVAGVAPPGYPDHAEIVAQMSAAAAAFPAICQFVNLTETYNLPATFEGRHMYALKISDNVAVDEDEPTFLLVSAHHGREIVTPIIALHAIEQFTSLYGSDPTITALVDENEIWVAPVWNPDGYEYAFNVDNTWRKNRTIFPDGTGVELNRNYPFGWSSACSGPTSPASGSYKGPSPASEAETQTMVALTEDRRFAKVLDFHSSGTEVLRGYHCLNHPFQTFLISQAQSLATAFGFGGRTRPPSAEGEHYEWQFAMMGAQANLVETRVAAQSSFADAQQEAIDLFPGILYSLQRPIMLGGHVTDAGTGEPLVATLRYLEIPFENEETNSSGGPFGQYHVFLPAGEVTIEFFAPGYVSQYHVVNIDPLAAQTLEVQLVRAALNMTLVDGPSGLLEIGEAPQVVIEITAGSENYVPGSALLFYRYDDGGFLSTPLTPAGGNLHSATLPTLDLCGQKEYYVVAQGDGGTQVRLPASAPGLTFSFGVGEPQTLVAFDGAWRYFKGVQEPSTGDLTAWTEISFDDTGWEPGAGSFGYGSDCDPFGTVLDDMPGSYRSVYLRKPFSIVDPAIVLELGLTADYDDAFVAYINGVEVARNNVEGSPPLFDTLASSDHECSGSASSPNPPEFFTVHESVDLATLLVAGENVLAIQGHNLTDTSSDFTLEMTLSGVLCGCNDGTDCDDGNPCNGVETCIDDLCVSGTPVDCAPLICDPVDGSCVTCLGDQDCDDGDLCNGLEICDGGACVPGAVLDCSDGVACTDDLCDPALGCSNPDNCTGAELCNPSTGVCEEPAVDPLPIVEGDEWSYFKGTQEPSPGDLTDWTLPGFDDSFWLRGNSGFGYGIDCSHNSTLSDMQDTYASLYLRRPFLVDNPASLEELTLTLDYDDAFVAYVNGVEVARSNVLGIPPSHATVAQLDHECSGSSGAANPPESFDLQLSFDLTDLLQPGINILAVQGHNLTLGSSDFTVLPELSAVETAPCIDPAECADGDLCTVDDCDAGICVHVPVSCPAGEVCNPDDGLCELQVTLLLQEGLGGYSGTVDTFVQQDPTGANNDNGSLEALNWDTDDPLGSGYTNMTLIRFDHLFGSGVNQIPNGASIRWATLSYTVGGDSDAPGDDGDLHEMLVPWTGAVAWNTLGSTPGAVVGEDYSAEIVASLPGGPAETHVVNVTASLQAWSGSPSTNQGWIVVPTNTNGADVRSSEYGADPMLRPLLIVTYVEGVECVLDADCDDGDACNGVELCESDQCVAGTPLDCDDGDVCNGLETCDPATGCVSGSPLDCDDGDACTQDSCDPAAGCEYEPVNCDNGDACDGLETCEPAVGCVAGTPPVCDDGDVCNGLETCEPATGCVSGLPLDCDDGDACTQDVCNPAAGCEYEPVVCDNGDACDGLETCDPAVGCVAGTPPVCDDGDVCNGLETCEPATGCVSGSLLDCDDGDACTQDACNPVAGCEYEPVTCDNGDACDGLETCDPAIGCVAGTPPVCDDGDVCNGLETCEPTTGCVSGLPLDCDDGDACTQDSCDPAAGCEYEPVTCDNGDACDGLETCDPAIGCVAGTPPVCDDGDVCNGLETCEPTTGCVSGLPLDCNDGDACTQDACDPAAGCEYEPVACDNGDACDGLETCDPAIGCVAGTPPVCDDGDVCNGLETCEPATGCGSGSTLDCDDGDGCTTDTCDSLAGCHNEPVVCDDGIFCNGSETCEAGDCVAGPPPSCDDGDSCTADTCDAGLDDCTHVAPPIPAEVRELRLHEPASDSTVTVLTWNAEPLADSYNVYRGIQRDLNDLSCFQSGVSGTSTEDDGSLADPGMAMWFLTTADNCRGESVLGHDRVNSGPCP